uniref:Uncharacterized protein n=1 Tax=Arundo donax TaxID=35708 RepID=A0A0A9HFJ8_ARUDO
MPSPPKNGAVPPEHSLNAPSSVSSAAMIRAVASAFFSASRANRIVYHGDPTLSSTKAAQKRAVARW